jgi:hypothetical protein
MKTPTIAKILHYAADKKLASKRSEYWLHSTVDKEKYSCCAMHEAVRDLCYNLDWEQRDALIQRIETGLKNMGCPTGSIDAFDDDCDVNSENQQSRYVWLKFAAKMAEEQGV